MSSKINCEANKSGNNRTNKNANIETKTDNESTPNFGKRNTFTGDKNCTFHSTLNDDSDVELLDDCECLSIYDELSEYNDSDDSDKSTFDGFGNNGNSKMDEFTSDGDLGEPNEETFEGFGEGCIKTRRAPTNSHTDEDTVEKEVDCTNKLAQTSEANTVGVSDASNSFEGFEFDCSLNNTEDSDMNKSRRKSHYLYTTSILPEAETVKQKQQGTSPKPLSSRSKKVPTSPVKTRQKTFTSPSQTSNSYSTPSKSTSPTKSSPSKSASKIKQEHDPDFIGDHCSSIGCTISWLESGAVMCCDVNNGIVYELSEFAKKIAWERSYVAEWILRLRGHPSKTVQISEEDLQKIHMVNKRRKAISVTFSGKILLKPKLLAFDSEIFKLPAENSLKHVVHQHEATIERNCLLSRTENSQLIASKSTAIKTKKEIKNEKIAPMKSSKVSNNSKNRSVSTFNDKVSPTVMAKSTCTELLHENKFSNQNILVKEKHQSSNIGSIASEVSSSPMPSKTDVQMQLPFSQTIKYSCKKGKNDIVGKHIMHSVFEIRNDYIGQFCKKKDLTVSILNDPRKFKTTFNNGMIQDLYVFFKERGATLASLVHKLYKLSNNPLPKNIGSVMSRIQRVVNVDQVQKTREYLLSTFDLEEFSEAAPCTNIPDQFSGSVNHSPPATKPESQPIHKISSSPSKVQKESRVSTRSSSKGVDNKLTTEVKTKTAKDRDITGRFCSIKDELNTTVKTKAAMSNNIAGDEVIMQDLKRSEGKSGEITRGDIVQLYYNWLQLKNKDSDSVFVIDLLNEVEKLMISRGLEVLRIPVGTLMSSSVKLYEEYKRFREASEQDALAYLEDDWLEDIQYLLSQAKSRRHTTEDTVNVNKPDARSSPQSNDTVKKYSNTSNTSSCLNTAEENESSQIKGNSNVGEHDKTNNQSTKSFSLKRRSGSTMCKESPGKKRARISDSEKSLTSPKIEYYPAENIIDGNEFIDLTFAYKVDNIVTCRMSSTDHGLSYEYLVKWNDPHKVKNTWVTEKNFPSRCGYITKFWKDNPTKVMDICKILDHRGLDISDTSNWKYLVLWKTYNSESWLQYGDLSFFNKKLLEEYLISVHNKDKSILNNHVENVGDINEINKSNSNNKRTSSLSEDIASKSENKDTAIEDHMDDGVQPSYSTDYENNSPKNIQDTTDNIASSSTDTQKLLFGKGQRFKNLTELLCHHESKKSDIPLKEKGLRSTNMVTKGKVLSIYNEWRDLHMRSNNNDGISTENLDELRCKVKLLMESCNREYKYNNCLLSVCYSLYVSRAIIRKPKDIKLFNSSDCMHVFDKAYQELKKTSASVNNIEQLLSSKQEAKVSSSTDVLVFKKQSTADGEQEQESIVNKMIATQDRLRQSIQELQEGVVDIELALSQSERSNGVNPVVNTVKTMKTAISSLEKEQRMNEVKVTEIKKHLEKEKAIKSLKKYGFEGDDLSDLLKMVADNMT